MPLPNAAVLIVDDEPLNIYSLKATLKARGFNCYEAPGAMKALEVLAAHSDIGIVLIDVMMPDIDGYEFISILRQHETYKNLPLIVVTAKAMNGDKEKVMAAGANEYVSKPINVDLLVGYLHTYLN